MRYIACLLLLLLTFTFKVHAEGTYYILNTDDSLDGSADALNYSQGNVLTIDKFNKFIIITQGRVGPTHHFAWSNDNGTTWTEGSEEYSFLTRGSIAYDENNDKLHVIWTASDANDGIIYRRYGITRDGSNNITAISREDSGNINLQLDTSSIGGTLPQPVAIWHDDGTANGILIAIWGKYGAGLAEIRGSMRNLSLSAADGNGANWKALDNVADTFSVDAPLVAADKIYGATSGGAYASAIIKNNDLYIFVASTNTTGGAIIRAYKGDFATNDWSGVWTGPINMGSFDNTSGYSLKGELITKPVLDTTNDRIYIGWPTWKDGTDGDTVRFSYLDSADTPSAVYNVYSALGTHSYAPTLDLAYDEDQDLVYISYVESTTNGSNGSIKYKIFDGTSLSSENTFYTNNTGSAGEDGSADIPVMYKSRYDNKLLFLFRVNGALPPTALNPHTIFYGYQTLPIKPNIQFNTTNSSGLESLTSVNIPVSINSTFTRDISVNYAVTSSTATSGSDFTLASGTLNIASGDLTNNINLSIINDVNVESSETITITLSSPVFANLGSNTTFIYTILDNDTSTTPRTSNNKSSNRCTSSTPEYDVEITNVEKISTNKIKVYFKDKSKRVTKYDVRYGFSKNNLFFKKGNVAKKGDNNITLHINNLDNVNLYLSIKNNNNCKTGDWSDTYHFKKLNTNSIVTNFVNTIIKPSPTPVPTVKRIEVQKQDNNKNQAVKNIQEKPTVTTKTEPGIFKNIQNFFSNLFN